MCSLDKKNKLRNMCVWLLVQLVVKSSDYDFDSWHYSKIKFQIIVRNNQNI